MKGILFLIALILPMFAASFVHCTKMLMVPCSVLCGTKTRRLSAILNLADDCNQDASSDALDHGHDRRYAANSHPV